jgi:hypothetical protein
VVAQLPLKSFQGEAAPQQDNGEENCQKHKHCQRLLHFVANRRISGPGSTVSRSRLVRSDGGSGVHSGIGPAARGTSR